MAALDDLRRAFSGSPVTLDDLEALLGADGVLELRRKYFPRWRPGRVHAAGESVRGLKAVVVEDEFEGEVVKALAPRELSVQIRIAQAV